MSNIHCTFVESKTNNPMKKSISYEFIETQRTDGHKQFTYVGALRRIKSLVKQENKQNPNLWANHKAMSNDDLIELGFLHFGFEHFEE